MTIKWILAIVAIILFFVSNYYLGIFIEACFKLGYLFSNKKTVTEKGVEETPKFGFPTFLIKLLLFLGIGGIGAILCFLFLK